MNLILDYASWRCGDEGDNTLGKGNTCLLNNEGFMCCLGQWTLQLNPDLKKEELLGYCEPHEIKKLIPSLTIEDDDEDDGYINSSLSNTAMIINDDINTTSEEKIVKLSELLLMNGHELKVINKS